LKDLFYVDLTEDYFLRKKNCWLSAAGNRQQSPYPLFDRRSPTDFVGSCSLYNIPLRWNHLKQRGRSIYL
jgi:hypothetical protein